jgi:hypothetical protein
MRRTTEAKFIDRHSLVLTRVSLNGFPAQITGIREDYAMVRSLRGEYASQFAWETVLQVVNSGGKFNS